MQTFAMQVYALPTGLRSAVVRCAPSGINPISCQPEPDDEADRSCRPDAHSPETDEPQPPPEGGTLFDIIAHQ